MNGIQVDSDQASRDCNESSRNQPPRNRASRYGTLKLAGIGAVLAAIWLFALPWIGNRPVVRSHHQFLRDRGIDPSAMFYTELDAMDPILAELERKPAAP